MATIPEAIQIALAHHQAGRLQQAEQIYRQVLEVQPRHAGAMHLLGQVIAPQAGRYEVAVELISNAIRLDGFHATFHANLGEAYRGLGRLAEAKVCYEQALRIQTQHARAATTTWARCLQAQGPAGRSHRLLSESHRRETRLS